MNEKENFLVVEWCPRTFAQALFIHAVIMPEIEEVVRSYDGVLAELEKIED